MKKWFLHILLLAGLFGALTTSCSQEVDGLDLGTDGKVQVMFTIALDSQSAGSRATWGDNYDDETTNDYASAIGDDFDNYINPDQFFVKLTLGNTTYDVQNIAHWQQAGNKNVYEFVGEVDVNINATTSYQNAKIQVYANMNPTDNTFATDYDTNPGTGVAYIPMWGVQTVNLSLTPGARTELTEPIYLLRAMAKVEVIMAAEEYTLTRLSLNRYNTQGYSLPNGAASVNNTKTLHYDNETPQSFNPYTTASSGTDLAFEVKDNHLVFYLPEVTNSTADELMMTVTLKKGSDLVQLNAPYLYFRNYNAEGNSENTVPFDVIRNHWYKYTITAVHTDILVELKTLLYQAQDWTTKPSVNIEYN